MRFRAAFTWGQLWVGLLGVVAGRLGGVHCGKQFAGKMGGTRALRCKVCRTTRDSSKFEKKLPGYTMVPEDLFF